MKKSIILIIVASFLVASSCAIFIIYRTYKLASTPVALQLSLPVQDSLTNMPDQIIYINDNDGYWVDTIYYLFDSVKVEFPKILAQKNATVISISAQKEITINRVVSLMEIAKENKVKVILTAKQ